MIKGRVCRRNGRRGDVGKLDLAGCPRPDDDGSRRRPRESISRWRGNEAVTPTRSPASGGQAIRTPLTSPHSGRPETGAIHSPPSEPARSNGPGVSILSKSRATATRPFGKGDGRRSTWPDLVGNVPKCGQPNAKDSTADKIAPLSKLWGDRLGGGLAGINLFVRCLRKRR